MPAESDAPEDTASGDAASKAGDAAKEPADDLVTTSHSITIDGEELSYTATAGRVVLRTEAHTDDKFDGPQPKAEVFMVAYTVDGTDAAKRPVTFAFNGGPGSSSIWLHWRRAAPGADGRRR